MRDLVVLFIHLIVTLAKLLRPGGVNAVVAESLLMKHQLQISDRHRRRAPNLTARDRFIFGLLSQFISPRRFPKLAVLIKPATLLRFHSALVKRKYRMLFSSHAAHRKPGPKGPSPEVIAAVVGMKQRNQRFGYVRIAQQISFDFGIELDKDTIRRILAQHHHHDPGSDGPSWLSFLANSADSLYSLDLFRCESILLRSYWVMVIVDVFSRRIIGFSVERAPVDGISVCRMFNRIISGREPPKRISTDHDPLFRFHRWLANLRILGIDEIKTVPYTPVSHPYVERLIGTIRGEYLNHLFFWNSVDLERKLDAFKQYYNETRVHRSLDGRTPAVQVASKQRDPLRLERFTWKSYCNGLFSTPVAV